MKIEKKKATDYLSSTAIDENQLLNLNNNIISNMQSKSNENNENILDTLSLNEIYDTVFTPRKQIVEGMLYSGAYLFVGAPKVGKSFFMAQLGYCISKGLPLWNYKVNGGTVLYLALEDDFSRIEKRLSTMFGDEDNENFHFATRSKNLTEGLEEQLSNFLLKHTDTKLIIIDTLQKVREKGGEKLATPVIMILHQHLKSLRTNIISVFWWFITLENSNLKIALMMYRVQMVYLERWTVHLLW